MAPRDGWESRIVVVRYKTQADADHLIHTLEKYEYKLKVRPLGDIYLGMAKFDRPNKIVSISMPGYVKKMLQRFRPQFLLPGHRPPRTPGIYIAPKFSKKPQTVFIDRSEKLSPALITELQAIIGTLLLLIPVQPVPNSVKLSRMLRLELWG